MLHHTACLKELMLLLKLVVRTNGLFKKSEIRVEKKYFLALLSSHTLSFLCLDVRLSSGEKWQRWTNVPTGFGLVSEYDGESYGAGHGQMDVN